MAARWVFDAMLGRGKRSAGPSKSDRLFALTTAYITLETSVGMTTRGAAAIVFQPLGTGDFATVVTDVEEIVRATGQETGTSVETTEDTFGYRWMILRDPDVEDLVVGVNAVRDASPPAVRRSSCAPCSPFPTPRWRSRLPHLQRSAAAGTRSSGAGEQQRQQRSCACAPARHGAALERDDRWLALWDPDLMTEHGLTLPGPTRPRRSTSGSSSASRSSRRAHVAHHRAFRRTARAGGTLPTARSAHRPGPWRCVAGSRPSRGPSPGPSPQGGAIRHRGGGISRRSAGPRPGRG